MSITVVLPRSKYRSISQIIRNRYTELWNQWRVENYPNRSYSRAKLNANILNALSVNGKTFNEHFFRPATINKWRGGKVLPFAHWYFLVRFQADIFGKVYAIVEDACYEGDYHNDTMNTKPYGECALRGLNIITENKNNIMKNKKVIRLTESDLHNIIQESVKSVLKELDWKTYTSAAERQREYNAPKPKGRDYRFYQDKKGERARRFTQAAADAFQRDYGNVNSYTYMIGTDDGRFGYTQKMDPSNRRAIEYRSSSNPNEYGIRDVENRGVDMYDDVKTERRPQEFDRMGRESRKNKEYDYFNAFDKMEDEYKSMDLDTIPKYRKNPRKYIKGKGWQ